MFLVLSFFALTLMIDFVRYIQTNDKTELIFFGMIIECMCFYVEP